MKNITFHTAQTLRNIFYIKDTTNMIVGGFGYGFDSQKLIDFAIIKLDDYDVDLVKNFVLPKGRQIFRCQSEKMKNHPMGIGNKTGYDTLVLIDIYLDRIYFCMNEFDSETPIRFNKKGIKINYLNMLESEFTNK